MPSATGDSQPQSALIWNDTQTNAADATTTKAVASRRDIAPRGSSRDAVRGFIASKRASTSRLNPIAALRADDHRQHNPAHLRPGNRMLARRQQRPGQRERQREDGVAEADEREIGDEAGHLG